MQVRVLGSVFYKVRPGKYLKKNPGRGNSPAIVRIALLWVVAVFHVVEHPVPHDKQPGNDHVREQPGAEECAREDEFSVHHHHPQASAGTVSAQVSTFVRMLSSEYDVSPMLSRLNVTM